MLAATATLVALLACAFTPGAPAAQNENVAEQPAVVVGYLVDASGNLLVEDWRITASHEVRAGEPFLFEVSIQRIERKLRLLDEGGQPVAHTLIRWIPERSDNRKQFKAQAMTDASGVFSATLPAGSYRVFRRDSPKNVALVEWRDGQGLMTHTLPSKQD